MRNCAWVPILAPAAILAAWELLVRISLLDALFFPPPSRLAAVFVEMFREGVILTDAQITLTRTLTGFAIGALAGIGLGVAMGASPVVRRAFDPLVSALYATPKLTLLPMLMLIAGIGETPRQIVIATTAFLLVLMNTLDGVSGIPKHFVEMAQNYGASRAMLFRRVYLPASAPHIFTGLRIAMGRSLVVAISVELVGGVASGGLGSLIWRSWMTFSTERLFVAVITSAVLGAVIHRLFILAESRLIPWKPR